jgi:thrombospondin type 3 repeat protein
MKVGVLATMIFGALIGYPIASLAGLAPDADSDGVPDVLDKCMLDARNVGQASCDTDQDGYGNVCDGDFNNNGTTNTQDFTMYFAPQLKSSIPDSRGTDMNCNGTVNTQDFTMYFAPKLKSGTGGGPSGLACAGTVPCN